MKSAMTARTVYLMKRDRVLMGEPGSHSNEPLVAAFARNIETLGYTLSPALFDRLSSQSEEMVVRLYNEVVPVLRQKVGAHRRFRPMYPNFPKQVMEASDLELYINARMHYFSAWLSDLARTPDLVWMPKYPEEARSPLAEPVQLRVVDLGSEEDFERLFTRLLQSNAALPEADRELVTWFVQNRRESVERLLPESIPQKETLALLASALASTGIPEALASRLKTATDVLRVAVALSGSDLSLAQAPRFRSFSRAERRFLLGALEGCAEPTEDMLRWKGYWLRLGERLHPGEMKARYPKAFQAFQVLRDALPFQTHNARVEEALSQGDTPKALSLLGNRPGDFARRLDHVLRTASTQETADVVDGFLAVAERVSTPVLLQVFHHFQTRSDQRERRLFFPKGNVAKVQVVENAVAAVDAETARRLAEGVRGILVTRFRTREPLGRVYVDPALASQVVPFATRSASRSLRTLVRGSRVALPETNTLRFFLWWTDGEGRTDLDLSAVFYDTDWQQSAVVSYFDLRNYGCAHSGDITSAPRGACEFIDLDRRVLRENGVRYVAMSVNSFTSQPFHSLPECFAGWMARQQAQSGEVFEPRTVQDRVDLTAGTTVAIPVVFDLEKGEAIWADLALRNQNAINNVDRNGRSLALMAQAIAELNKPNLYDLFQMHVEARGQRVDSPEEAEQVFSLYEGVTPFEPERILSEFLA